MTDSQWERFCTFKSEFKQKIEEWQNQLEEKGLCAELYELQKRAADKDGVPPYSIDTPLVYNRSLDDIEKDDKISLIVIGDNPGKNEQLVQNRRYLVGQSGKIAEGFFRKNPDLGIDFRKNVIILNKTPVHTAKTKELSLLIREGNPAFAKLINESQIWCAQSTVKLHQAFFCDDKVNTSCALWLVGYAELKGKGLFIPYRDALSAAYADNSGTAGLDNRASQAVFVYQHFSMNRFLIDLKDNTTDDLSLRENLAVLGRLHRQQIFGW